MKHHVSQTVKIIIKQPMPLFKKRSNILPQLTLFAISISHKAAEGAAL